jgi:thioredoxin 1
MEPIVITNENFEEEVIQSDVPILIDFWAPWCGPCRMVSPIVDEIAKETDGSYAVGKVNVDESPELAEKFGVASIPTLIVMKDGELVNRAVGALPKKSILELLGK